MTRVLVTGGRGILGSKVVSRLSERGYTVRIMSRSPSRLSPDSKQEWAQADMETGNGLREAVLNTDIIVHCATSPFKRSYQVEVEGTKRLLEYASDAGVKHLFYISIVGVDKLPFFYYEHKYAAEKVIKAGNVPWTILRPTQFHDLIDVLLNGVKWLPIWLLPTHFTFQPIDSGEVAAHVVTLVEAGPSGHVADIGGPEVLSLEQMAQVWKRAQGIHRPMIRVSLPRRFSLSTPEGYNLAPGNKFGKITWAEWVQHKYGGQTVNNSQPRKVVQ